MEVPIQAALFLGIIPALFLMFICLKGYDSYYKDKLIFLTFIAGIILGVIAAVVRLRIIAEPLVIAFLILYAFFEQLFKTIILNIGRFQLKKETVIYGLSLGLGFGSSFTPFLIIVGSLSGASSYFYLSIIGIGSIGFILFHAATGAYIGFGIYKGKMMRYLLIAILLQIPFNIIADLTRSYTSVYFSFYQAGLVLYGLIFFLYVVKKVMPQIKEDNDKRKSTKN
ncbi:MAG: protease PrsW [Thermoplasmatales archaeon]|nr:protease PrsW [Thermoplasmatales archaeon]